jgi:hypothetical protein
LRHVPTSTFASWRRSASRPSRSTAWTAIARSPTCRRDQREAGPKRRRSLPIFHRRQVGECAIAVQAVEREGRDADRRHDAKVDVGTCRKPQGLTFDEHAEAGLGCIRIEGGKRQDA